MSICEIKAIAGREAIQKNFAKLTDRAETYAKRRVSLNERFSLIERGYALVKREPNLDGFFQTLRVRLVDHGKACPLLQFFPMLFSICPQRTCRFTIRRRQGMTSQDEGILANSRLHPALEYAQLLTEILAIPD
jgi:hypothetical protein